jgi:rhamnosyltransferase
MLQSEIKLGNANLNANLRTFGEPLVTGTPVSDVAHAAVFSSENLLRKTAVIIPTYNASRHWGQLHTALEQQGLSAEQILIVDSSSSDDTRKLARRAGYRLKQIPQESFRHGATRQMAAESLSWAEILVYLTQDSVPNGEEAVKNLVAAFGDPEVGATYGRQLPRPQADPIERHARLFNYPEISDIRTFASRNRLGIKAAFISNSFAAYRRLALLEVGGFPKNSIVSEEVTVAARMLIANWKVAYQADATSFHSHPLSMGQEFSRYFDIGVHHGRAKWLLHAFGGAGDEGRTFVRSQMRYLANTKPSDIPAAAFRNLSKWCSYHLGLHEKYIPIAIKEKLSGYPHFWEEERELLNAANSNVKHYRLDSSPNDLNDERSRERRFEGLI